MLKGRIWNTWMSRFWRYLNNLCVAQHPRTIILQRRSQRCLFFQKGVVICVFRLLFAQFPRRGCFLLMFSVRHEDVFTERSNRSQAGSSPAWDMESNNIPKTQYTNWDKLCLDPVQAEFYRSTKHQRDRRSLQPGLSLRKHIFFLPSVQGINQIKVCLCALLWVCFFYSTKHTERSMANPWGPLYLWLNNMMSREKPQEQATKNDLHPVDELQASLQWYCSL